MPIIRQTELKKLKSEFDDRCERLRHALIGSPANINVWNFYSLNPDDFNRDFIEIDADVLLTFVEDLQVSLKKLKKIEKLRATQLGQVK